MDESHRTIVVATLSPSPTDVEHSLNTLQHVAMMRTARAWEESRKFEDCAIFSDDMRLIV